MEDLAGPSRAEMSGKADFYGLVGQSASRYQLYSLIAKVSNQNCAVIILGESGTGKELVAHAIHDLGPRAARPFTPVDCLLIPVCLLIWPRAAGKLRQRKLDVASDSFDGDSDTLFCSSKVSAKAKDLNLARQYVGRV